MLYQQDIPAPKSLTSNERSPEIFCFLLRLASISSTAETLRKTCLKVKQKWSHKRGGSWPRVYFHRNMKGKVQIVGVWKGGGSWSGVCLHGLMVIKVHTQWNKMILLNMNLYLSPAHTQARTLTQTQNTNTSPTLSISLSHTPPSLSPPHLSLTISL